MARLPLPRNQEAKPSNGRSNDPLKQIPQYPRMVRKGGSPWRFTGLTDTSLFPSPFHTGWDENWVPYDTRGMMLNHHKISQGINNIKNGIVGRGGRSIPAVSPYGPQKDDFDKAVEIMRLCDYSLRQMNNANSLNGDNWTVNKQMLDCLHSGVKIAPIDMRDEETGIYKGARVLDQLNVWENDRFSFWGDEFGNFDEVRVNGVTAPDEGRFSREKFYILTWRPVNGNPYGTSLLRAAYDPYYKDIMVDYEEMAYVSQFGRPSIIIFSSPPPEKGGQLPTQKLYWPDGSPIWEEDPETGELVHRIGYEKEQNAINFTEFSAGSIWSMNFGCIVQVVEARAGGADMFRLLRDQNARNMMAALAGTHQNTESERSMGQGNAEVGEGIAGLTYIEGRRMLEIAEETQLLRQVVYQNYGPNFMHLIPIRDYGSGINARIPQIVNSMVGVINGGNFTDDQWWWICAGFGWPLPYPDGQPIRVRVLESKMKAKASAQNKNDQQNAGGGDKSSQGNPSGAGDGTTTSGGEQGSAGGDKNNDSK